MTCRAALVCRPTRGLWSSTPRCPVPARLRTVDRVLAAWKPGTPEPGLLVFSARLRHHRIQNAPDFLRRFAEPLESSWALPAGRRGCSPARAEDAPAIARLRRRAHRKRDRLRGLAGSAFRWVAFVPGAAAAR